jgi:hypothetical protein
MPKLIAFILTLTMFGTAGTAAAQTPVTDHQTWSVTDQQEIEVAGEPASISPDGEWLAGPGDNDNFCIWSLPELEAYCDGEELRPELISIAWAPDSSAVAFSQDAARLLIDSDIAVFDIETRQLTNLTDIPGEARDPLTASAGDYVADIMPVWTADGSTILFVRAVAGDSAYNTNIMSVDVQTGDVTPYFLVTPTYFLSIFTPMFLEPDGSLLISINHPDTENQQNGIWRISPGGTRIDRPFEPDNEFWRSMVTMSDVAADGSYAVLTSHSIMNSGESDESPYALLDLESGDLLPIPGEGSTFSWWDITGEPRFIGEASELYFPVSEFEGGEAALVIGSSTPYALAPLPADTQLRTGIHWSESGKFLIPTSGGGTILTVEPANDDSGTPPPPCSCLPPEGD